MTTMQYPRPSPESALRRYDENMARIKARSKPPTATRSTPNSEEKSGNPEILPTWPAPVRAVPNAVLRGALFTVRQERATCNKRTLVASVKGIEIRFKGERFNQTDLDVWETILHLARAQQLGAKVRFSAHALLTMLGRQHGKTQHEQLKEDITRLAGSVVEVTSNEGRTFGGSLVQAYYRDESSQLYAIELSPQLLSLYQTGNSYIDWNEREGLGKANLAKWLHGFFSSHEAPLPYKVATIKDLCGADRDQRLGDFRKALRKAMDLLKARTTLILDWHIDDHDLLHIKKKLAVPHGEK